MRTTPSPVGLLLAGIYLAACIALIATQGLFGESFIAILLGLPWTLGLAAIEFGGASGPLLYVLVLAPMALNAAILYWIGSLFRRKS